MNTQNNEIGKLKFETSVADYAQKIGKAVEAVDIVSDWKMTFNGSFAVESLVYFLTEIAETMIEDNLGLNIQSVLNHPAVVANSLYVTYGKENYKVVYIRLIRAYYDSDVEYNTALFAVKKIMSKHADEVSFTAKDTQRFWFDKS